MHDSRTYSLIRAAIFASRQEYRHELVEELRKIKETNSATREELYEVFLQSYLFAGFPCALESLRSLGKIFGHEQSDLKNEEEVIAEYKNYFAAGDSLYKKVYASNAERVKEELIRISPDLAAWALIEGYGKTLSRPNLDMKTRELCIVAMLTQLGWERQLYSHILGAKNIGAKPEEIEEAAKIGSKEDEMKFLIAEQLIRKIV